MRGIVGIKISCYNTDIKESIVKNKAWFFFLTAGLLLSFSNVQADNKNLPKRYKKWLEEEVVYIIAPLESEVFLQLKTDRERDVFIEAFWRQRDPTLNTPENEFKTEHYKRIKYANQFLGKGVPKAGWRTDRGRIHIILGEPNDIQRFVGKTQVYPTEVWFYQGLTHKGLPPGFNLVFFQKRAIGEYRLYSPLGDGPQALLTSYFGGYTDYMAAYNQLRELEPYLAPYALSLIPGERAAALGRPTMSSDILINKVESSPVREIESKYARKFLEYKDLVEVEYSANFIDSYSMVKVSKDPSGTYFVHYAMEPERLSVNQYQDKFYTTIKMNGIVSDEQGKIIYQFEKTYPLEFDQEKMKTVQSRPVSLRDMFPLVPGNYRLSVLLKNEISKEFTSLERNLFIPGEEDPLQMTDLLLSYNISKKILPPNRLRPFQSGKYQVFFQANRVFLKKDDLIVTYQIHGLGPAGRENAKIKYSFFQNDKEFRDFSRPIKEYADMPDILEKFSLQDFPPAHYRIQVSLFVGGREVLVERDEFDVTYVESIARPWVYSKLIKGTQSPIYSHIIGSQLFNQGKIETAAEKMEQAYRAFPGTTDFGLDLARLYLQTKKYAKIPPILQPYTIRSEPPAYEVYFILGKAYQFLGETAQAIEVFNRALNQYGLNTNLLNTLGECYLQLGNAQEAEAAWKKSLEINADQPKIKKSLDTLKKKK